MNLRCLFGHDRMPVPHLPGYGFAPAWTCRRCPAHFEGFRYPPAPPPLKATPRPPPAIVRAESLMKMAPSGLLVPTLWSTLDYEEGVWRPAVGDDLIIHGEFPAYYTKVGKLVTVQFQITTHPGGAALEIVSR